MATYRRNKETGVVEQLFTNKATGEKKWYPTKLERLPGEPLRAPGEKRRRGDPTRRQRQVVTERYREALEAAQSEALFERDKEAQEMGTFEKGMILAGKEVDKLGAGMANIGDFLGDVAGMDTTDRFLARQQEQAQNDELTQQLENQAGAAQLFKAMPYLATGYGVGPMTQKVAQGAINRAGQAAVATGQAGKGLLTRGVNRLAQTPGPTGQMGRRMQREWTQPLAERAAIKAKQVQYTNPYREGAASRVLGDTLLGGAESGIHYDQSIPEGMIASMAGRTGGELIGPSMRRSPDFYAPEERRIMDWGEKQGMRFLPGQRTGNRGQQMFEAGLRTDQAWTDTVRGYDRANEVIQNRIAYKAMGVPEGNIDRMTPDKLQEHMDSLSKQYQELEAGTTGRLDAPIMRSLDNHVKQLELVKGVDGEKAAKAAQDALEELQRISTREIKRDRRGRMISRNFDGKEYQSFRRRLKDQIDGAFTKGDNAKGRALQPLLEALDTGMEKGLKDAGGDATVGAWKDLNERYAMTKLVIDHGSTTTGNVDLTRLKNHFKSTDPQRLLLESGGRVADLFRLVKLNDVMKGQAGSALSGTNMNSFKVNPGKQSMRQRFLSTPMAGMVPVIPDMMMRGYARGYPSVTGLANMGSGPNALLGGNLGAFWDQPGLYTRALAQGTQVHPKAIKGGLDSLKWLSGKAEEGIDMMGNLFSSEEN